jgi:hypothetical protein
MKNGASSRPGTQAILIIQWLTLTCIARWCLVPLLAIGREK